MRKVNLLALVAATMLATGCADLGKTTVAAPVEKPTVDTAVKTTAVADVTYRKDIKPLLEKYCAECHSAKADSPTMAEFKLDEDKYKKAKVGPRSDTYEDLLQLVNGASTGAFMRRLDDGTNPYAQGKPGNMYKYLGETDAERAANFKIVTAWVVGEGNKWDMNGIKQRGDMPPITLEQLRKMKLKY